MNILDTELLCNYIRSMRYRVPLNGHEVLEGKTPDDIVEALSRLQWPSPQGKPISTTDYMREVSERVKAQKNRAVRVCCSKHFIEDLEAVGTIKRLPE